MLSSSCTFFVPKTAAPVKISHKLDISRLLFDLKLCGELVSQFTGCLDTDAIATCVTNGLVNRFGCTFARIWLVEEDRTALRLVASSGLYTRLDGSFARVPMGAFKVGKIAQHCIPFLSNYLPEEPWVKDREWAIANKIQGFAGLPLMLNNQAIGVLAIFTRAAMAPEFLEALQVLSISVVGALSSAMNHQAAIADIATTNVETQSLSEQLARVLGGHKLSLLGTEQIAAPPVNKLLLHLAKRLTQMDCHYCRLVYEPAQITLEAMLAANLQAGTDLTDEFSEFSVAATELGGRFQLLLSSNQKVVNLQLQLPREIAAQPVASEQSELSATTGRSSSSSDSPLSKREQDVIELLVQGLRDREISEQLYISERTVKFHVKNMLNKLNVKTRIQAVYEATRKGWIE